MMKAPIDPTVANAPQHEVTVFAADSSRTVEMRLVPMTAKGQRYCSICESPLDLHGRPWTRSCGGDCLACMAEVGDPDCVAAIAAMAGGMPEGWKLVPVEPTEAMERASRLTHEFGEGINIARIHMWGSDAWAAMLAAAPDPALSKMETVAAPPTPHPEP